MRGRLGFFVGFGAGYVLGAKAGKERYEQLRRLYENLQDSPAFRRATNRARGAAQSGLDQARGMAAEGAHKVSDAVRERRPDDGGLSIAPSS